MRLMLTVAALCSVGVAALPPVDHFTRYPDYEQARISPTGKYLAVTTKMDDFEYLTVIELARNQILYRTHFGKNWDIADFHWATAERILVQPAVRIPGRTDFSFLTGEIYGLNADGGDAAVLFGYGDRGGLAARVGRTKRTRAFAEILHMLPDQPRHVLIGTTPFGASLRPGRAYRLNIRSGQLDLVANGRYPTSRFVADRGGEVRFEIGETDDNVTEVYYRRPEGTDLVSSGPVDKGVVTPLAELGDGWFYAVDNVATETSSLVRWHPGTGEKETLFHEPTVDIGAAIVDADNRLIAVRYDKHYPDYHYVEPDSKLAIAHRRIRAAFPGEDVRFTSLTSDGASAVVVVYGDLTPATFYLVELENNRVVELLQARPWLSTKDLNPMEPVELTTRDGTVVHGYLTTPAGWTQADPLPMIVLVHGGPHGVRDYWGFDYEAQLFASRGYAVLQVNFRGSGGYGRQFLHAGYGRWGREMQDDVTDATRWAVSAGIADPDRLCIYGGSYGGYAALTGAFREPDLYRCAVGYVGVYDLEMALSKGDIPRLRRGLNYLKAAVGEDTSELRARSPAHNAERIEAAVMLVHGGQDTRVPLAQAKAMRRALRAAGRPVEVWHVESMEGHGFGQRENRREMYTKMLAFFDRHTGPDVEAARNQRR
ncbi:MAG: S9 family peptidase [Gammaproteobacteria bacterium]|nr:S9 family peptidase [Gammaproteobacteria bacterium]